MRIFSTIHTILRGRRGAAALLLAAAVLCARGVAAMDEKGPDAYSPWALKPGQIVDMRGIIMKLATSRGALHEYVRDSLSPGDQKLLEFYPDNAPPDPRLTDSVIGAMNRMIFEDMLLDDNLIAGVPLSIRTEHLIAKSAEHADVPQINRRILEDAFPGEIAPCWILPCFIESADLTDSRALAVKLRSGGDAVSHHLHGRLPAELRDSLISYSGPEPPGTNLQNSIAAFLNEIILSPEPLYEKRRFLDVRLSDQTKSFLQEDPENERLQVLHRLLLEDAFPGMIRRIASSPIEIMADSLEYEHGKNLTIGSGRVLLNKDDEYLRSDYAVINMQTHDVLAEGNVTFERGNDVWVGDRLQYNFKTQKGDFGQFSAFLDPFYIKAESSRRVGEKYLLDRVILSTCEHEPHEAYFRAKRAWLIPGRHVRAQHVVFYLKGVPIMYSPYWNQNIGDRNFISIVPGYNSRMYAYLLTAFNYRITPKIEASTHLDPRMRRGVGLGQDIMWSSSGNAKGLSTERYSDQIDHDFWYFTRMSRDRDEEDERDKDTWAGDLILYHIHDAWPDEGDTQAYKIDSERYRARLFHNQSFDERNYLMSQLNYLSDPEVIEQFFRREYKTNPEPENYIVLGHRAEFFTLNLSVEKRFNDFYTSIDRLPELSIDFSRRKIMDTPFFYQGETAGAYLRKNWESNKKLPDYDAGRLDTAHMVYYPTKQFGFLNVIPRAGWRGTYYSKTKEGRTNVTTVTKLSTNSLPVETSVTNVFFLDRGAKFRSLPELGLETSFKAFKVWETYPGHIINNVRHIAEPYADYSLVPEPDVEPGELYQFDEIDELGKLNQIRFGMRNKIQTQRFAGRQFNRHKVQDLINADVWIVYRLDPAQGENTFSNICWDVRSSPFGWMEMKTDGSFDQYETEFQNFNTRLTINKRPLWEYFIEHRYHRQRSNLLNNEITLAPFANWEYSAYARYEFEDSTIEAWGVTVQKNLECVAYKAGLEIQDDEYSFWIQFWLTKFPKARVDIGL